MGILISVYEYLKPCEKCISCGIKIQFNKEKDKIVVEELSHGPEGSLSIYGVDNDKDTAIKYWSTDLPIVGTDKEFQAYPNTYKPSYKWSEEDAKGKHEFYTLMRQSFDNQVYVDKDSKVLQNRRAIPARIQGGFRSLDGRGIIYSASGPAPPPLKGLKVTYSISDFNTYLARISEDESKAIQKLFISESEKATKEFIKETGSPFIQNYTIADKYHYEKLSKFFSSYLKSNDLTDKKYKNKANHKTLFISCLHYAMTDTFMGDTLVACREDVRMLDLTPLCRTLQR